MLRGVSPVRTGPGVLCGLLVPSPPRGAGSGRREGTQEPGQGTHDLNGKTLPGLVCSSLPITLRPVLPGPTLQPPLWTRQRPCCSE